MQKACRQSAETSHVSTGPVSCQTITRAYASHLTLSLAHTQDFEGPINEVERKYLKACRASERVTKSLSTFLLEVVTMKAVHSDSHSFLSTRSSQFNHFSLTCSFVHLPKCKISSEQRSKNVNNKNNRFYHRLFTQRRKLTHDLDFKNVNKSKTKTIRGSY